MADFTRFISYLYDYRAGERNRNLGFAKVESRQGMCRLTVCLNHGQVLQQNMALCGYIAGEDRAMLVRLGEMEKGSRERQWRFPAENLGGCGVELEQLAGLILLNEDRSAFLLSVWNDGHLTAEDIHRGAFLEKPRTRDVTQASQQEREAIREKEPTREVTPEKPQLRGEIQQEDREATMLSAASERTIGEMEDHTRYQADRDNDELVRGMRLSEGIDSSAVLRTPEMSKAQPPAVTAAPEPWRMLCKLFPAAKPFEPSAWEVLCISLQDIGRLPPENWVWGNNHFVLHGFYQYRHLILARQRVENRVYLGVPGEFGVNEKFMAAMFGLHRFERERKGKREMGYWLTPVNLNQI